MAFWKFSNDVKLQRLFVLGRK